MSSPRNRAKPGHRIEFLPETVADANDELGRDLKLEVVRRVRELEANAHAGELMGDKPPRILKGCRKIRFDLPGYSGKPRYRLVYRNEPEDGAVAVVTVLAIGRRDRMAAYAKAASRIRARLAQEGLGRRG